MSEAYQDETDEGQSFAQSVHAVSSLWRQSQSYTGQLEERLHYLMSDSLYISTPSL